MEHEGTLRLIFFVATAVSLGLWEARSPRRKHDPGRTYRWIGNESHETMLLGLHFFREQKYRSLPWLLAIPFISRKRAV